jgi:hypothetical protein
VRALGVLETAEPFVWLGKVLAISFVEAPVTFRAPGVTLPVGLAIGRLVFRALNLAEVVLAALLTAALAGAGAAPAVWALLGLTVVVLLVQVLAVRPGLDDRAERIIAGEVLPHSRRHLVYVALELAKVALLVALGVLVVTAPL